MSLDSSNAPRVGFAQAIAACIGAVLIYISQTGELGKHPSQILIYAAPVVTAVAGGVFSWLEESLREYLKDRKLKSKYDKVVKDGAELLQSEDLDPDARAKVTAVVNQAKISYISRNLDDFHEDLGSMRKANTEGAKQNNVIKD